MENTSILLQTFISISLLEILQDKWVKTSWITGNFNLSFFLWTAAFILHSAMYSLLKITRSGMFWRLQLQRLLLSTVSHSQQMSAQQVTQATQIPVEIQITFGRCQPKIYFYVQCLISKSKSSKLHFSGNTMMRQLTS